MKLRDDNTGDSLWLLLDTICNAFGGMLLIAILFALFSSRVRVAQDASRMAALNVELQERRIAMAKHDLELAQQSSTRLQALLTGSDLADRAGLIEKRDALRADAESLRGKTTGLSSSITELRSTTQQIPEERLKELRSQFDSENRVKTEKENALAAARQNLQRLQTRLVDLQNQTATEREAHVVKLRLPKESVQSKVSFPVIIRYEQIYLVHDPNHSFDHNTDALTFEHLLDGDDKVTPIRGRGVDLRECVRLLNTVPHDEFYIVCWVYGDSFRTFNQIKQLITSSGFEYGWSPMRPEDSLIMTSEKVTPPPPL